MQKTTQYNAPAAGGNPVAIRCTQVSSRMSLQEDAPGGEAYVFQGFIYQLATMLGNGTLFAGAGDSRRSDRGARAGRRLSGRPSA